MSSNGYIGETQMVESSVAFMAEPRAAHALATQEMDDARGMGGHAEEETGFWPRMDAARRLLAAALDRQPTPAGFAMCLYRDGHGPGTCAPGGSTRWLVFASEQALRHFVAHGLGYVPDVSLEDPTCLESQRAGFEILADRLRTGELDWPLAILQANRLVPYPWSVSWWGPIRNLTHGDDEYAEMLRAAFFGIDPGKMAEPEADGDAGDAATAHAAMDVDDPQAAWTIPCIEASALPGFMDFLRQLPR